MVMTSMGPYVPGAQVGSTAILILQTVLRQYGLTSLSNWAWNEVTAGATATQVLLAMYNTPQFATRFPGIMQRQKAGLPPISPATYVKYETQMKQLEHQYNLPQGILTTPKFVGTLIGGDVSASEVEARVQKGYTVVATAPPSTRQAFAQYFGVAGTGHLATYFLTPNNSAPLLQQQAQAAVFGGTAAQGNISMSRTMAMQLAQMGATQSGVQSAVQNLEKTAPLYNANVTENPNLTAGNQGLEAQLGLSAAATQQVQQRQQQREAEFSGGGSAYSDQYGAEGIGHARPF